MNCDLDKQQGNKVYHDNYYFFSREQAKESNRKGSDSFPSVLLRSSKGEHK